MRKPLIKKRRKTATKLAAPKVHFRVPRAVLEIYRFTTADKDRPNLNQILLEPEKIGKSNVTIVHAVATDGHRMLHASWELRKEDFLEEPICIYPPAVKDYLTKHVGKAKKTDYPLEFIIKRNGFRPADKKTPAYYLTASNKMTVPVEVPVPIDEATGKKKDLDVLKFPEWRRVLPKPLSSSSLVSTKFGINLDYLIDFGKYLKACGVMPSVIVNYNDESGTGPVCFEVMGIGNEINSEIREVNAEYIQMPVSL